MPDPHDDTFLGYHMRVVEDLLARLISAVDVTNKKLDLLSKKVDALGSEMTPAEKASVIAKLNADAAAITQVALTLTEAAGRLNTKE